MLEDGESPLEAAISNRKQLTLDVDKMKAYCAEVDAHERKMATKRVAVEQELEELGLWRLVGFVVPTHPHNCRHKMRVCATQKFVAQTPQLCARFDLGWQKESMSLRIMHFTNPNRSKELNLLSCVLQ